MFYIFFQSKCRLCEKIFCCVCCRKKHEKEKHNVFPDCNICIYGTIKISSISEEVLPHLQNTHWPLHCVRCKRIFNIPGEIKQHTECSVISNNYSGNSPYTPSINIFEDTTFESPPLVQLFEKNQECGNNLNVISNLATSTPMQECTEENNLLQKIKSVIITPVNSGDNTNENILKKTGHSGSPLKRRVTFCETILTDNMSLHGEFNYLLFSRIISTN